MKPVVDRLESEYRGTVEFRRYDVDVSDEGRELMRRYGATYLPTFIFLNRDGTEADRVAGEIAEDDLRAILDSLE